jgi:DNA-binding MarR family transcriptional regulator
MTQSEFVDEAVAHWGRLLPDQNMLGLDVAQRLVWSGRLAHRIMERGAIAAGLGRRGDYELLALLRRNEPDLLTPVDAAKKLLSSQSGMTGKLDRLEEQGLIQRLPDPEDRRVIRLRVTNSGRKTIDEAFRSSLGVYESMLHEMSPNEREQLATLLGKLLTRLDHLAKSKHAHTG